MHPVTMAAFADEFAKIAQADFDKEAGFLGDMRQTAMKGLRKYVVAPAALAGGVASAHPVAAGMGTVGTLAGGTAAVQTHMNEANRGLHMLQDLHQQGKWQQELNARLKANPHLSEY